VAHEPGLAERIGMIDLDVHFENGTADIVNRLHID